MFHITAMTCFLLSHRNNPVCCIRGYLIIFFEYVWRRQRASELFRYLNNLLAVLLLGWFLLFVEG